MVENQHRLIKAYREMTKAEIDMINVFKEKQAQLKEVILGLRKSSIAPNGRHLSIAETNLETAFMYITKCIAKPDE